MLLDGGGGVSHCASQHRRFIAGAHKGYRNNPYHNWRHAFDVTQMTYCLTRTTEAGRSLTPLEVFSLMLTSLCHDIDHGGKTNEFLVQVGAMPP
eukprot:COSAG01_NODE_35642_length_519_cov_0.397674_2_plen_93_part_01